MKKISLLNAEEPRAFEHLTYDDSKLGNWQKDSDLNIRPVLICDHASKLIPNALDNLGLSLQEQNRHIAYDIGVGAVTKIIAETYGIEAILANYSRLVIDLNRPKDDPTLIRQLYDHTLIRGNMGLTAEMVAERITLIYDPYHQQIAKILAAMKRENITPLIISMHSCTDAIHCKGKLVKRPWHIGILSNLDRRLAELGLSYFKQHHPELMIGDNLPYSGMDPYGFTLEHHAYKENIPNILFEIRQDLISNADGQALYAKHIGKFILSLFQSFKL